MVEGLRVYVLGFTTCHIAIMVLPAQQTWKLTWSPVTGAESVMLGVHVGLGERTQQCVLDNRHSRDSKRETQTERERGSERQRGPEREREW